MCVLYQLYCKQMKRELFFVGIITVKKFITFTVLWLLQLRLEKLHLGFPVIPFTIRKFYNIYS